MKRQFFLQGHEFTTPTLKQVMEDNPLSKSSILFFLKVYQSSKNYLDYSIFLQIRKQIEEISEVKFNLKKRLDKAKMGRFIVWGELTHRNALPHNLQPLNLLVSSESFSNQNSSNYTETKESSPETNFYKEKSVNQEKKQVDPDIDNYWKKLKEYENFCRFLLVGKILPKPVKTNGIECSPLFKIFKGVYTLDNLNIVYKELLQKWHPDLSCHSPHESSERFDYIRKAYHLIINNWNSFNPKNLEIPSSRVNRLKSQKLKWTPDSFWD